MTYCERLKKEAAARKDELHKLIEKDNTERIAKTNAEAWPILKSQFSNLTRIQRPGKNDEYEICGYRFHARQSIHRWGATAAYVLDPVDHTADTIWLFGASGISTEQRLGDYLLAMSSPAKPGFFARLFNL
jgi:hypothetical protein